MSRNSRLFFLIGVTVTILIYACKRDNTPHIRSEPGSLLTLTEAQQWYNQQKVGDLQTLSSKNGLGIPEWTKSTSLKLPVGKSQLKVEMSDPGSTKMVYRYLLFTKDLTGLITGSLQEIWPEPNYLSSKRGKANADGDVRQYIDYRDFTGAVLIYDLTGKFTKGRFYLAGTIADEVVSQSNKRLVKTENVDLPESFCSVHPEHPGCRWFRDQLGITLPEVTVTAPRINPTPTRDPDFTGFPQISTPRGGNISTNYSLNDINDRLSTLCFKNVLSELNSKTLQNTVSQILTNMFGSTDKLNLDFLEGSLKPNVDGDTRQSGASGEYKSFEITLNTNELKNASKEYIAATILHEVLHAYFGATGNKLIDHNEMGLFYINKMAEGLKEIYPSISNNDAIALAWGGVQESYSWSELKRNDPNATNAIIQTNINYKNGKTGTMCK